MAHFDDPGRNATRLAEAEPLEIRCPDRKRTPQDQMTRHARLALTLAASLTAGTVPALADVPVSALLGRIEPGSWDLRVREAGGQAERICVREPERLIQLRHPGVACQRIVVEETPSLVTVQYTCPGRGYGRTTIRMESNRLVQIDTQGIAGGLPFAFAAEGRRTGACAP
jgi:hypothetical protein